jgi:hypothetical protein
MQVGKILSIRTNAPGALEGDVGSFGFGVRAARLGIDRAILPAQCRRRVPMSKWILVLLLAISACGPALSAERYRSMLRGERHVVEVVRPPYSGSYIINGARFTAESAACTGWNAGERITLSAGDWHGRCVDAVFYNVARHRACRMWCG